MFGQKLYQWTPGNQPSPNLSAFLKRLCVQPAGPQVVDAQDADPRDFSTWTFLHITGKGENIIGVLRRVKVKFSAARRVHIIIDYTKSMKLCTATMVPIQYRNSRLPVTI